MSKYVVAFICFTLVFGSIILNTPTNINKDELIIEKTHLKFSYLYYKLRLTYFSLCRLTTIFNTNEYDSAIHRQAHLCKDADYIPVKVKTIYFIRHGQSVWNASFYNVKNVFKLFVSSVLLLLFEILFIFTNESFICDSPLTTNGISQSLDVAQFLSEAKNNPDLELDVAAITGTGKKSVLFASYLRRAQSTLMFILRSRLNKTNEHIYITHELEELVVNPDCVSLHSCFGSITFPLLEMIFSPESYEKYKRLKMVDDIKQPRNLCYTKMLSFFNRIFNNFTEDIFIVCGHSRWLRYALKIFLPPNSIDQDFSSTKLSNTGIVKIDIIMKMVRLYTFNIQNSPRRRMEKKCSCSIPAHSNLSTDHSIIDENTL